MATPQEKALKGPKYHKVLTKMYSKHKEGIPQEARDRASSGNSKSSIAYKKFLTK